MRRKREPKDHFGGSRQRPSKSPGRVKLARTYARIRCHCRQHALEACRKLRRGGQIPSPKALRSPHDWQYSPLNSSPLCIWVEGFAGTASPAFLRSQQTIDVSVRYRDRVKFTVLRLLQSRRGTSQKTRQTVVPESGRRPSANGGRGRRGRVRNGGGLERRSLSRSRGCSRALSSCCCRRGPPGCGASWRCSR